MPVFLPQLLQGAVLTVGIAVLGCLLAVAAGVLAAIARLYGPRPLRWLATTYVEIFRGTSALVQLFWLFFVLPQFGVTLAPFPSAVLALGLNVGAYGSEVVRGAILGVARGQWEAATALNMTPRRGAAPDHPAAGLRRDDPALGQPLHRAPQGDLAGFADHARRSHLQGPAAEPDHLQDRADLHASCCSCTS